MRHEKKRLLKICEELTSFLLAAGATHIESAIHRENGQYRLTFRADYATARRAELEELGEYFNRGGHFGAVEEYWELAGSSEADGTELLLVGMMTEQAEIQVTDDQVLLRLSVCAD
ncbi:MAG: hypothetical protein KH009_05340 [Clostridiales bacterium]|nr:hypothetical protein [Clostridiales bacterium]